MLASDKCSQAHPQKVFESRANFAVPLGADLEAC